jgi:protease II
MKKLKLSSILLILLFNSFVSNSQNSILEHEMEITKNTISGYELIKELESKTGYSINYSESVLKIPESISLMQAKGSVQYFLDRIFGKQEVEYIVKEQKILVKLKIHNQAIAKLNKLADFISISGTVTEYQTNIPIGFASINIEHQSIGTATNIEGGFIFHIPLECTNDTLVVSAMGYQSYRVAVNSILNEKLNVQLVTKVYPLSEIEVRPIDPFEIIKKAIAKIPENYPSEPINMDGFYREMTFENDTCVEMAEAACEFYYRPYGEQYKARDAVDRVFNYPENHFDFFSGMLDLPMISNPNNKLKIIEARASNLNHKQRFKVVPKGGPISSVSWDIVNDKYFLTNKKFLKKKRYKYEGISTYNNKEVFVISYKGKKGYRLNTRTFYIDTKSLAFIAIKIQSPVLESQTTQYWTPALYTKKRKKCEDLVLQKKETIRITYKDLNGKWYLNTVKDELSFDYIFSDSYKYKLKQDKISYKIEKDLLINHIRLKDLHEIPSEINFANSWYSVLYDYDLDYNREFWESYNCIKTTLLQDSIIRQLELHKPLDKQYADKFIKIDSLRSPKAKVETCENPFTGLPDDYYWMQDITNPEVLKYVEAENKYTENGLMPLKKYRRDLYQEMLNRHVKDTSQISMVKVIGEYSYYYKEKEGTNYCNLYRKNNKTGIEGLILDLQELSAENPNYDIEDYYISPNNEFIAYIENYGVDYENHLIVKDINSQKKLCQMDSVRIVLWQKDNAAFYYTSWDETNREDKLKYHHMGTNPEKDKITYYENNKQNDLFTCKFDDKWVLIYSSDDYHYSDIFLLDLYTSTFKQIVYSQKGINNNIQIDHDTLYSISYENGSSTLYYSSINKPQRTYWKPLITNLANGFETYSLLKDYIVINEPKQMAYSLKIFSKQGKFIKDLNFKAPSNVIHLKNNKDKRSMNKFRFDYSTLTEPYITYEFDIPTLQLTMIKQEKINEYNKEDYEAKLLWAESRDGLKIPISLVYNKRLTKLNGKSPLCLVAYGSYGANEDPEFCPEVLSLLDRGVIYAIAHVRGGGELGFAWHEKAMQLKKQNTFDDFIACAEFLIKENYTSKGKIVAEGGSAGGLIMGVIANQRPELFNSIILKSAYLDVLASLTDSTAKFSTTEHSEFGSPKYPEIFEYVKSYSPYQNIEAKDYPNMLYLIGLNDNRVEYWQNLKSIAKLRSLKTNNNRVYLKTDLFAGHSGNIGGNSLYADKAFIYSFILSNLGIKY